MPYRLTPLALLTPFLFILTACGGDTSVPTGIEPPGEPEIIEIANAITTVGGFGAPTVGGTTGQTTTTTISNDLDFSGQLLAGKVELAWALPDDENLAAINLRRDIDSISDFRKGVEVYRGKDSHFSDASAPLSDNVYYRLFFEMLDGSIVPSDEIVLRTLTVVNDDPPAEVANLRIVNSGTGFTLVWVNPADDDLRKITIYKNTGSAADTASQPRWSLNESDESLIDTDVTPGGHYHYAFVAEDALGQTSPITRIDDLFEDDIAPEPPRNLDAIIEATSIQLNWFESVSDDVASYLAIRHPSHPPLYTEATAQNSFTVLATSFTDSGLTLGTTYYYSVFSVDGHGNASSAAQINTVTANIARPSAPYELAINNAVNENEIGLQWQVPASTPAIDSLVLIASNQGYINTLTNLVDVERFDLPALSTNYTYTANNKDERFFSLFSVAGGVESTPVKIQATPKDTTAPAKALTFIATPANAGIQLNWTLPNDADLTDVIIQWDTTSPPADIQSGQRLTKLPAQNLSIFHSSVQAGQTYYYSLFTADGAENIAGGAGLTTTTIAPTVYVQESLSNVQALPSDEQVHLSWQTLSDTNLTIYIFGSINPNADLSDNANIITTLPGTETSYNHASISNGQTYNYWLYTENGASVQSSIIEISATPSDNLPPLQVQNVQAVPNIDSILLSWDEQNLTDATQIIIAMSENGAPQNSTQGTKIYNHEPGRGMAYSVGNLKEDTLYYFSFFTLDSENNESYPVSIYATTYDNIPPAQPENFQAAGGDNRISLWWDTPISDDVDRILLVRSETQINNPTDGVSFEIAGHQNVFADTTAINNTHYFYAVYFIDGAENYSSAARLEAFPIDTTAPLKVTQLQGNGSDNSIVLSWVNPMGAGTDFTKIIIRYQTGNLAIATPFGNENSWMTTDTNLTTHTITGLTNDQPYQVSVFTLDDANNFNGFEAVSALPQSTAPTPPALNFNAVAGDSVVHLSWTNPASNYDEIHIKRSSISYADALVSGVAVSGSFFPTGTTSYTDTGLPNGTTLFYALVNHGPNAPSSEVTASAIPTDQTEPFPISNLSSIPSDGQIRFNWNDPTDADLSHIHIRRGNLDFPLNENDGVEVATVTRGIQTATDSGLTNDQFYFYAFFAVDINGFHSQRVTKADAAKDTISPGPVTAASVANSEGQVTLNWTNPVDADLNKIVIRRSTTAYPVDHESNFSVASLDSGGGSIPETYTDTNLNDGSLYYYSIFALDQNANASTVTHLNGNPIDITAPLAVFGPAATVFDQRLDITWVNPADPDFDRVKILRRTGQYPVNYTDPLATLIYQGNGTSVSDTNGLVNATPYYYRFFSLDEFDNANQTDLTVTPVDLTPPSLVVCTSCTSGDMTVILNWTDPPEGDLATIYVRRGTTTYPTTILEGTGVGSATGAVMPAVQTITDPALTNGTDYRYSIFTQDLLANTSAAYQVPLLTPTDTINPDPVTLLTAPDTNQQVVLSWTNPTDDTVTIHIRRSTASFPIDNNSGTLVQSLALAGVTQGYTDSTVTNGTPYFYSLFSEDEAGNISVAATLASTPTDLTPPANVTGLITTGGDYQVNLSWANPGDADFSQVVIRRHTNSSFTFNTGTYVTTLASPINIYTNTLLSANTTYYYKVFAGDALNNFASGTVAGSYNNATTDYPVISEATINLTMEKDGTSFIKWTPTSETHYNHVEIRRRSDGTPPANPTDGTAVYSGTGNYFEDTGLTNGTAYDYTLFSFEDDGEYTSGVSYVLTPVVSGELEHEGPVNFDGTGAGQATALEHDGGFQLVGARHSAADPQVSLTSIDYNGELTSLGNIAIENGPNDYAIEDIQEYSSYWYATGLIDDGDSDFRMWKFYNSLSALYASTKYDTGSSNNNDAANNLIAYSGWFYASGFREIAAVNYPVVWSPDYYANVQVAFNSGSWTIPTAAGAGEVIDHIRMSDGYQVFAIESPTTDSLIKASVNSSGGTLLASFATAGELLLADAEVTSLSRAYNTESSVGYPFYTSTVTAGGDTKLYALTSTGANVGTFNSGTPLTLTDGSGDLRIEDIVIEPISNQLHVIGSREETGDRDIMYWRISNTGNIEITKRLTDGMLGSAGFEDQYPDRILLEPYTYQILFTGTGYDGGSGYEILYGRISND